MSLNRVSRAAGAALVLGLAGGAVQADDLDFQSRCNASGVLVCKGFDGAADMAEILPAWDGVVRGTVDTGNKASGAGSLRFEIPPYSAANSSGSWLGSLGKGFGQNSRFYVQFRQRFSKTMLETNYTGGGGWKQVILHRYGASCAAVELTTQNIYHSGFPRMYTNCGGRDLIVPVGSDDFLLQQGDYNCLYSDRNTTDCSYYKPDQWMTFYWDVQIGEWGQPNSNIKAYVAYEGQPLKQFIDMRNFTLHNDTGVSDTYSRIQLTPYNTGKSSAQNHPTAYTWYDELIVSTAPIAAPDGGTTVGSGGGGDVTPPAPPSDLMFQP